MAKYALSFTTQCDTPGTYYLAASVIGLLAKKHGSSTIQFGGGAINTESAETLQHYIDDIIDSPGTWDDFQCYPAAAASKPASISGKATTTKSEIDHYSFDSGPTLYLGALAGWLAGTLSANVASYCSRVVEEATPYINHRISTMGQADYEALMAAVIEAGGFSAYKQTNTPVQA